MILVNVIIDGILLYCDESVASLTLGNGYIIKKVNLDDLPFKSKVSDGNGQLMVSYLGSRMYEPDNTVSLMCLHKDEKFQIQPPQLKANGYLTDDDIMCSDQLEAYKDREMAYLNKAFALLHLYKEGNIGPKEVFFEHRFTMMGFFKNTKKQTSDSVTRNIVDTMIFSLTDQEVDECNRFLMRASSLEFAMLKNSIDEFVWGLEQVDVPTGFEQYTTALEMTLLGTNQQCKKETLSKRTAVLLEYDHTEIVTLYNKMKNFYRYRSESLHEGNGENITSVELKELEDIVRKVLNKYLDFCKIAIQHNPTITWDEIKANKIIDMKNTVTALISSGVLPT